MIEGIKKLGLNEYEARAYKALLKTGRGSAVAISRLGHIPRARVYDVLLSLEGKGFVMKSASKPIEFSVIKPTQAVESLAALKKLELERDLGDFRGIAKELEQNVVYTQPFERDSAWILEGRHNIYSKIGEELENCKESVVIASSEEGIKRKKGFFGEKLDDLAGRGVKITAKTRSDSRFIVFDNSRALLFLNHDKTDDANDKALLVHSPFIANYLNASAKK